MLQTNGRWLGRDVSPKRSVPPPRQPLCDFRIDQRQRAATQRKLSKILMLTPYYWKLRGYVGKARKVAFHHARGSNNELQRQTKDNNEKTRQLREALAQCTASEKEAWNCYRKAENTQSMYEGKYREVVERCAELEQQYETECKKASVFEARLNGLSEETATKASRISELEASNTELVRQRQETVELNSIRTELAETKASLAQARSQAKVHEKARLKLDTSLAIAAEKTQKELSEAKAELSATKNSLTDLQSKYADLNEVKETIEEGLRDLKDDHAATTLQNREMSSQLADKTAKVQRLQEEIHSIKEQFLSSKEMLSASRIEATDNKSMVRSLNVRMETLQTEKRQLELHLEDVSSLEKEASSANTRLNNKLQKMTETLFEAEEKILALESSPRIVNTNTARSDTTADEIDYFREQLQLTQSELDQTRSNAKQRISDLMHQLAVEREKTSSAKKQLGQVAENSHTDAEKLKFAEKREATIYKQLHEEKATTAKLSSELQNVLQTLNR
eukprot:TRINITY_DN12803_c0_g1_i1.p1 TRINITY_DN12803_c0_g1~~TRINITY_DN12803_c0_g1_i1.p1  ORF type:complete len:508 (+),score=136.01 TRINITY_DN12803_c0_g1_i1:109-1632(+)